MIYLVIAIAFLVRIISLNQSFWLDEAVNVVYAQKLDFWTYVTTYSLADYHPAGWFIILWLWVHLFGASEIAVRLLSVIFALATIYVCFLIGRELISKSAGLLAALFLSLAPLHIYYSQEARMYSFSAFASALLFYGLVRLIHKKRFGRIIYITSVILVLYSDYVAYFMLPAQMLYIIIAQRKYFKEFLYVLTIGLLSFIPWSYFFFKQFTLGQATAAAIPGWKAIVGGAGIKQIGLLIVKTLIGRISFSNHYVYALVVLLIVIPYTVLIAAFFTNRNKHKTIIKFWLILPVILALICSFLIPVFSYFRLLFILPAFYLMVAWGAKDLLDKSSLLTKAMLAVVIISELITSGIYLLDKSFQREDWRDAVRFVNASVKANSLVLFEDNVVMAPFIYYAKPSVQAAPALKKITAFDDQDLNDLKLLTKNRQVVYLFDYLVEVNDPKRLVQKKLQQLGFYESHIDNFNGVGFIRKFSRYNHLK